ncbi:MAG: type II toxin-antitoxin system RelE/ParE family toxin [Acidobacteria bacterium]|nr:type II toxin-antitoxin system RelE/ParE family toxin [Acidobacteriota bacterium]
MAKAYPATWPVNGSNRRRLPGKPGSVHEDLFEIWSYIARDSVAAANRVESELFETFEALARTPGQGHKRTDLTSEAVLFSLVYSYLVVYRPEKRPFEIVAIIHGARNVRRVLAERSRSQ